MNLGDTLERHPVVAFVLVAYAVSWTAWTARSALADPNSLAGLGLYAFAGLGPAIAAVLVVAARGDGLREWAGRILRVRVPLRYYAVALALPVVGVVAAGSLHVLAFGEPWTLDALPSPLEYPVFLAFVVLVFGGQEEPGWRGFMLPRLAERHSTLAAALVVGVVWVGWHVPLFVLPDTIQSGIAFPLYAVQLVAMSVILAWLTVAARWSVLPAVLLHAGGNAVANYYPVGGPEGAVSVVGYGLLTGLLVLVAVALVVRFGPSLRADDRRSRPDHVVTAD